MYHNTISSLLPSMVSNVLNSESYDVHEQNETYQKAQQFTHTAELLELFNTNVATGRTALLVTDDEVMLQMWTMYAGGKEFTTQRTIDSKG